MFGNYNECYQKKLHKLRSKHCVFPQPANAPLAVHRSRKLIPEFRLHLPRSAASLFWMPSWVSAEVEVDCEAGKVRIVHLVVGAHSGRTVNALACHRQIEGAALQAMGQSLFEELRYKGIEAGKCNAARLPGAACEGSSLPLRILQPGAWRRRPVRGQRYRGKRAYSGLRAQ